MARKIKKSHKPMPDYLIRQKASMKRTHRQVIYLNDAEKAAVDEYCSRFGVKGRSAIFRKATIEKILSELDGSHPTLF